MEIDQDALGEAMLTLRPQVWKDQEARALAGEIPAAQIPMLTEIWSVQFRPYLERAIKAYLDALSMRESGIVARAIEIDFEKGTALFDVPDGSRWSLGKYRIIPEAEEQGRRGRDD